MNTEAFFIQECVAHARTRLPVKEALEFLHGMLVMCGDHPSVAIVREAYVAMSSSDKQLELIQIGQHPLNKK